MKQPFDRRVGGALAVVTMMLGTGACAAQQGGAQDSGTSVEAGATKAEYIEAMKDLEPIEFVMQSLNPKGDNNSIPLEDYAAALEEWSGGKIQPKIAYSSSIASAAETGEALADGRVDFARHTPVYEPEEYPDNNRLVDLSIQGGRKPVTDWLQRVGAFNQVGLEDESITAEFEDHGLKPALPVWKPTPATVLACTEEPAVTLEDMKGLTARATGPIHVEQLEALGITPSGLDIAEIYEGLQRGVIDCGEMALSTAQVSGVLDVANQISYGTEVGFADSGAAMSFSQSFWDEAPLVVRQLLWDRLDVFVESTLISSVDVEAEVIDTVRSNGGSFEAWDPAAEQVLAEFNEQKLDELRGEDEELVGSVEEGMETWASVVSESGVTDNGAYADLPEWHDSVTPSLKVFAQRFNEDVLQPLRPE